MAASNGIIQQLERKVVISTATPERHTALRAVADQLSKRNVDSATCELMNEALSRLVQLAYEQDAGPSAAVGINSLCNVDGATGRFLIPLPFGRNGHVRWGLRPQEANILRQILFDWQLEPPALLVYDKSRRAWFINLAHFSNIGIAKAWLRAHPVTVAVYRAARAKRVAR